ncbi:MAG: UDP-N-acetylmuramate--L-alanine ligase [Deltaproteobacteria bacterium]
MATTGTSWPASRVTAPEVRAGERQWRSAHLVGVCGSGMKALAELLTGLGWTVSGSDNNASEAVVAALSRRGLRIHPGHHGRFLADKTDVLVYSPAIGPENAERQRALAVGIPQLSYSQMLGALMRIRKGVCIAGTHGKSTTTAMTGCILTAAGLAAAVVVGAEVREIGVSGWSGSGECFVVESCEFQKSFLDLSPRHAAILGIEPDHFDCYPHFDETIAAFSEFAQRVPGDGRLLIHAGCEASKAACVAAGASVETFSVENAGIESSADWHAADLVPTAAGTRFRVFHQGDFLAEISLRIPGLHNVANALAAAALAHAAGAAPAAIREALGDFPGIRRRFEPVGSWRGVTLIDDYAHHPTAVAGTLATARARYPRRRLWCVFQPHQVSRTEALFSEFTASLAGADRVLLVPVFAAREQVRDEPALVSRRLAGQIVASGGAARFVDTLDQALATLEDELRPGDVLITMGAGDIGKVHHALTRAVPGHHAPRRTPGSLHLAEDRGSGAISDHPADSPRTR